MFTDEDVGKPVEASDGEKIGVVASVEDDVAYVRPTDDAVTDRPRRLHPDSVREITDELVRLEADRSVEERRYRGLEADWTELASSDGDPVTPDEFSAEPDEDVDPTDAEIEPDDDMDPTDAVVDPDADLDPTTGSGRDRPTNRDDEDETG